MNSIEKAELYFIISINNIKESKAELEEDQFLQKLIEIQEDEFNKKFCANILRKKTFDGEISYQEYTLPLKIYIGNYRDYNSSLIYLKVSIHNSIKLNDFSNLIYGKNILKNTHVNNETLFEYISQYLEDHVELDELEEIFLFLQIAKTNPKLPNTYDEGMEFIEEHKQNIHQLLLRSDTYHKHLRIDNHQSNFKSIANFYGTIDLCSPITLIQFYQYPIHSIVKNCDEIDINHRACWWLVATDMIFIQKSVLADTLEKINEILNIGEMKTIKATTQMGKVLLNMKAFWYYEDLVHEISKAVLIRVKEKVGVTSMLDSVLKRVEYLENMILREHNYYLNIILLIIAMIQIVPLIHNMLYSIFIQNTGFSYTQLLLWVRSFVISITLALIIYILYKFKKRNFTGTMFAAKKSKTDN